MVLAHQQILERIQNENMIEEFDEHMITNCGYRLRVGKVFLPETGEQLVFDSVVDGKTKDHHILKPAGMVVIMTEEKIAMPNDLLGSYESLYRMSSEGLMLINSCIIEPGYQGHLSCHLVNFSSKDIVLRKRDPIAKLCLHELTQDPSPMSKLTISDTDYERNLASQAVHYSHSFVGISELVKIAAEVDDKIKKSSEDAKGEVKKEFKSSFLTGSTIIIILLAWATLQPLFSTWVWDKTGHSDLIKIRTQLEELSTAKVSPIIELDNRITELNKEIENLKKEKSDQENK